MLCIVFIVIAIHALHLNSNDEQFSTTFNADVLPTTSVIPEVSSTTISGQRVSTQSTYVPDSLSDMIEPKIHSDNTLEMDARDTLFESDVTVAEDVTVLEGGDIVNKDGVRFSNEANKVIQNEQKITDIEGQVVNLVNEISQI